jgi:hypothetical protein
LPFLRHRRKLTGAATPTMTRRAIEAYDAFGREAAQPA